MDETLKTLPLLRLSAESLLPTRAHPDDAGLDLYSAENITLPPQCGKAIRTGIAVALPKMHVGLIADRSSLAKKGLKCAGGVIDAGYRGEIQIVLWNLSREEIKLNQGERIAQLLILPVATPSPIEVTTLDETLRGKNGFGSSGK